MKTSVPTPADTSETLTALDWAPACSWRRVVRWSDSGGVIVNEESGCAEAASWAVSCLSCSSLRLWCDTHLRVFRATSCAADWTGFCLDCNHITPIADDLFLVRRLGGAV